MNTKFLTKILGLTAVVALGATALLYKYQNKLIYLPDMPRDPSRNPFGQRDPSEAGIQNWRDVEITARDGVKLRGWMILSDRPTTNPTLIYYHENAGNIGQRINFIKFLTRRLPINVLIVAYRGYSRSDSVPSEEGLKLDAQAILNYAQESPDVNWNKIYVLGRSLGGAVASYVAAKSADRNIIKGVILENTFTSLYDVVKTMLPLPSWLIHLVLRNKWESIKEIPFFSCPILFITGDRDEIIAPKLMQKLIKAARDSGKTLTEYNIAQGNHNVMWQYERDTYIQKIAAFLKIQPSPRI